MSAIGTLGEILVGRWLELQDYNLLQQNWHCRWGEIDIIAREKGSQTVAFVEVKTRSKNNWDENGLLAVNQTKQEKIIKTASLFLAKYHHLAELPCQFDVALVSCGKLLPKLNKAKNSGKTTKVEEDCYKITRLTRLTIGKPVMIGQYELTIENYLESAFELS